jgi:hypothetical protein
VAGAIWSRIGDDILRLEKEAGFDLGPWRAAWETMGIEG